MRLRIAVVLGSLALIAAAAVPAIASARHSSATNATTLVATLTGAGEVPPVNTKMAGLAQFTIDVDKRLICYELIVTGKRKPTAAHIHEGAAGVNGGVVVDLGAFGQPVSRDSVGCTRTVPKSTLMDIVGNPAGYYVNVHTPANPPGEVRGQLAAD